MSGHRPEWAETFAAVTDRAATAAARYGPPASTAESYGVLAEEVAELLDAIRANNLVAVIREADDVAAVAMRLAAECRRVGAIPDEPAGQYEADPFVRRSTK